MHKRQFHGYLILLAILGLVVSCKNTTATAEPSPTPTVIEPTPTVTSTPTAIPTSTAMPIPTLKSYPNSNPNGLTPDKCVVEQQLLPHVCGIVPGETSQKEVQALIGKVEMDSIATGDCRFCGPGWETINAYYWKDNINLAVYFSSGVVVSTMSALPSNVLTLREAVQTLGPPEQVIFHLLPEAAPPEWEDRRADRGIFLWPNEGIFLETILEGTTGVEFDRSAEVPLLPADMPIYSIVTFEPCTLEELQAYFMDFGYSPDYPNERWTEWSGLEE